MHPLFWICQNGFLTIVIMHEMTHLVYPNHSKEFWVKVGEVEFSERARGFLMAKGMEEMETDDDEVSTE